MASVGEHGWPFGNEGEEQIPAWASRYAFTPWHEGRRSGVRMWMIEGGQPCLVEWTCDGLAQFAARFRQAIDRRWANPDHPEVSPVRAWRNRVRLGRPASGRPVKGWRTFRSIEVTTRGIPPDRLGLEFLDESGGHAGDRESPLATVDTDEANYLLLWLEQAHDEHCAPEE